MLLDIPNVLTQAQVDQARAALESSGWIDGRVSAGPQAARMKDNLQLPHDHPVTLEWGDIILGALQQNALFMSAALPLKVFPPMFNRYSGGQSFGTHIDNAIRQVPGTPHRVRTDLSATLFLTDPDDYDGGELVIEDVFGTKSVKLPAGHLVLYPAASLHHVRPVMRGARVSSFFWVQSMVRDDAHRELMFRLDSSIQQLNEDVPDHPVALQLTGLYHNLLRQWADA